MLAFHDVEITPANWTETLIPATMTTIEIQDMLGDVNKLRKWLDKVEGYLKEAIVPRFEEAEWEYATGRYLVKRIAGTSVTINKEKVIEEMGQDWWNEHTKQTDYYKLVITEIKT